MAVISFNKDAKGERDSITIQGNEEEIERIVHYVKHMYDKPIACNCDNNEYEDVAVHNAVNKPAHYCSGKIETIKKIEIVLSGIYGESAYDLGNILKYFDRAGLKDDTKQDLDKANNYAHRLIYGKWRNE